MHHVILPHQLKIGELTIEPPLVLSSLSGISDLGYRTLARRHGCPLAFYEMVEVNSVIYGNLKTMTMRLKSDAKDRPIGGQVLGSDPEKLLEAALVVQEHGVDIIDLNAACPVPKVVNNKSGAYLLKEPGQLAMAIEKLAGGLKVPVTVKIRSGWCEEQINAPEIARIAEDCGASAVFVHGRTARQKYTGRVCYKVIEEVKKNVKIPVIGSGDVFSGPLAKKMLEETGCDGIVVARGSLGYPWIFREIAQYLKDGVCPPPDRREMLETILEHVEMTVQTHGEHRGMSRLKKHLSWYLSHMNLPGRKKLKNEIFAMKSTRELNEKLREFL